MKNTIITSISALVFLVIGLFIGKSNKQIEIQTIIKTNIVEKPIDRIVEKIVEKQVVEYVDKYITNVIEKVVEADIPDEYITAYIVHKKILSSNYVDFEKLPSGIETINVEVLVGKKFENILDKSILKDLIEVEARKVGLKIDKNSKFDLTFTADGFEINNNIYANNFRIALSRKVYFLSDDNLFYSKSIDVWSSGTFGALGKDVLNQKYVLNDISVKMISFCNKYLETKQK
jgi:hypothetical protein